MPEDEHEMDTAGHLQEKSLAGLYCTLPVSTG